MPEQDAIIVGSGHNGLAAGIVLAQAGWSVTVYEAHEIIGGGTRTMELTLPGFKHDVCSAIHPLGLGSPFFSTLPLEQYGLEWVHPPIPMAHPFDDGTSAVLARTIEATGASLGMDADAYRRLIEPFVNHWEKLTPDIIGPLRLPNHPILLARFGLQALRSAEGLVKSWFKGAKARALVAGIAAHCTMPLDWIPTASFGLVLAYMGHAVGWPIPRGGSQSMANALAGYLQSLGGKIITGTRINSIDELPPSRAILLDLTPREVLRIAGHKLPPRYKRQLEAYRYGAGVFKIDWALSGPIPWRSEECRQAGTIHLGPRYEDIARSERAVWRGAISETPFMIVAQQSLFDDTRAPAGQHTGWAYCHVPHGSTVDMTDIMERQIERFAPGFRDLILARRTTNTEQLEQYNPNFVGGDINGGVQDIWQLFTRPTWRFVPYSTPVRGLYLCSSATPPGGGVHGMGGYHAAKAVLTQMK